jgi:hypothetical protein
MLEAKCPENFVEFKREPLEGNFVIVQCDIHGKRRIFYTGEVMCFKGDDNDYEAIFLRRSSALGDKFIKSEIEDRVSVHEKQIKMILPKLSFSGQTEAEMLLSFGVDFSLININ